MEDTLIVIFIAEVDPDYVYQISAEVQKQFQKHLGEMVDFGFCIIFFLFLKFQILVWLKSFHHLENFIQIWLH